MGVGDLEVCGAAHEGWRRIHGQSSKSSGSKLQTKKHPSSLRSSAADAPAAPSC